MQAKTNRSTSSFAGSSALQRPVLLSEAVRTRAARDHSEPSLIIQNLLCLHHPQEPETLSVVTAHNARYLDLRWRTDLLPHLGETQEG